MRENLSSRRASWTIKVRIEDQVVYLCCGEYDDGRLGEMFIDVNKNGTFVNGVLGALGRVVSVALQNGVPAVEIVKALKHLNFPPNGSVCGSDRVSEATSIPDWIAREIESVYVNSPDPVISGRMESGTSLTPEVSMSGGNSFGLVSDSKWS